MFTLRVKKAIEETFIIFAGENLYKINMAAC